MHLIQLMWSTASESKLFHSHYSQLSQAGKTAEPIQVTDPLILIDSDTVLHTNLIHWIWFGSCEVHMASEPGHRVNSKMNDQLWLLQYNTMVLLENLCYGIGSKPTADRFSLRYTHLSWGRTYDIKLTHEKYHHEEMKVLKCWPLALCQSNKSLKI